MRCTRCGRSRRTFNPDSSVRWRRRDAIKYTMDGARNGFPAGTVVQPSSVFMGYTVASVVDGIGDRGKLDWTRSAWASAETPGMGQSLSFALPQPATAKSVTITFATDNGKPYPSQKLAVKLQSTDGTWTDAAIPEGSHPVTMTIRLPDEPINGLKIEQAPGGGPAGRPDIMWVAQVALNR